jgi:hypothetical protein
MEVLIIMVKTYDKVGRESGNFPSEEEDVGKFKRHHEKIKREKYIKELLYV